jgi:hypothetical protein
MGVDSDLLLKAGLSLMAGTGRSLTRISTDRRVNIYRTDEGRTVRGRTCNLHVLPLVRTKAEVGMSGVPERLLRVVSETDFTLVVTPEEERTAGAVNAYLIPKDVILEHILAADRAGRQDWSLFLNDEKWSRYRLSGSAYAEGLPEAEAEAEAEEEAEVEDDGEPLQGSASPRSLGEVIAEARRNIAAAAHVEESAVKIRIDLS